jgi:hypothetical protein
MVVFGGFWVATAASAQVFPRVVEFEASTSASVRIDVPPTPLEESDSAFDTDVRGPLAEALAEIQRVPFRNPGAQSDVVADGWAPGSNAITLGAQARLDLEPWPSGSAARARVAQGSWSHRLVFEIDRRSRVSASIRPAAFDSAVLLVSEPGRLVGPDGEVFSGEPAPGLSSWIWLVTLEPGEYTFETLAEFELAIDGASGSSDLPTTEVRFTFLDAPCPVDFDGDGALTIFDFLAFQTAFDAGEPAADFDGDGEFTIFDFLAFQTAFDAGCE